MQLKEELRKTVKQNRRKIQEKNLKDKAITDRFLNSTYYKTAKTILCYMSLPDEIKTDFIINQALNDKKTVAVPYCIDDLGHMQFYIINSLDDLIIGSFNIREPDIRKSNVLDDFSKSIIIVPALCFDKKGYRLGYGKGYYDRFLQNYPFISVGLCYNSLIVQNIPINELDIAVNYIITESKLIDCNNGGKNG